MPKETSTAPLAQWYVICLRPLNLHAGVRRAAAKLGARTFALSTLRIVPRAAGDGLVNALACPRVLVTSPAAVRLAQAQRPLIMHPGQLWFAPGTGSASALQRCGIKHVLTPVIGADSAALLAHPQLQEIRGQRIGVISAPGGRGLLEKTLRERGAEVVIAHVYRREQLSLPKTRIAALLALPRASACVSPVRRGAWYSMRPHTRALELVLEPVQALPARLLALFYKQILRSQVKTH